MKILIIGGGGREHAISYKIAENPRVEKIYCAPGNAGTEELGENIPIPVEDIDALLDFARKEKIDLTVVGPELPLVEGIVERFEEEGLRIFGVNKSVARLEGSKEFSKRFMKKYGVPTARYKEYTDLEEAIKGIGDFGFPLVIKADGLCAGKGVVICEDEEAARASLKEILEDKCFGDQGSMVVLEEFLLGEEASLLCFVSGGEIFPMESARDYKKIYEGDLGPNTGGVGCYSPSPLFNQKLMDNIHRDIIKNIERGLEEEEMDFRGILFIGLMIDEDQPKVIEFNVRFGDPETQVLMPRLESDLVEIFEKTIDGTLSLEDLKWKEESCLTVIATSDGYPGDFERGFEIRGMEKLDQDLILFHNGTKKAGDKTLTNSGRVLSFTSLGDSLETARDKVYSNIDRVEFKGMKYRKDI